MKEIKETISTKIAHECDVLVVGGGFAGIAAALSAARMGKKVILVEKSFYLGGLGTSGLVTIYLPICDGMGKQVSFGIAEELLKLSIEYDCDGKLGVKNWIEGEGTRDEKSPRYEVNFNPALFATSAEQALLKAGVNILYGVSLVSAVTEEGKIRYAIIEGVERLHGACVEATDLRGGAAMVFAALSAEGYSEVHKIEHIERGYTDFMPILQGLGANITME